MSRASAAVPAGLLAQRLDALYTAERGRIVATNSWEMRLAPRFHLMLTVEGPLVRFRGDVPADVARELEALAARETWDPAARTPRALPRYVELLAAAAPVQAIWSGPAFAALRPVAPLGPAVEIGADNAGLLRGGLDEWLPDAPHRKPFLAVVEEGRAISLCASVRISPAVHCAGVETAPEHRRRGHALVAVSAWAQAVQALGATPFYSTSWDNAASRAVAARLGFQFVATDVHIT